MRNMKLKTLFILILIVNSIFYIASYSIEATDVNIYDGTGDVWSIDFLTGEAKIITSHPDINVDSLDLVQATYTQQGTKATVSLQVKGNIEDRGGLIDWENESILNSLNTVYYEFSVSTSEQDYLISYSNNTGMEQYNDVQINLTSYDFSVVGNTLTMSFTLSSASESYLNLNVVSYFIKGKLLEPFNLILLSDIAPNPPLVINKIDAPDIGFIGEPIQFNASLEPFTGTPPFAYHWSFGDGSNSTQPNPTHIYRSKGNFTYTFTITDSVDTTANQSGNISIYDNYQLKTAFLFGKFQYTNTEGEYITIEAVSLWIILFKPFQFLHYIAGETIVLAKDYNGIIIGNHFLFGRFFVVIPKHKNES